MYLNFKHVQLVNCICMPLTRIQLSMFYKNIQTLLQLLNPSVNKRVNETNDIFQCIIINLINNNHLVTSLNFIIKYICH